jgi:hypothetical protein
MRHQLFTITLLIAALVLYGAGMTAGGSALFAAGAACELWFWARILRRRSSAKSFTAPR